MFVLRPMLMRMLSQKAVNLMHMYVLVTVRYPHSGD